MLDLGMPVGRVSWQSKGEAAAVQQLDEDSVAPYICPVTMVEMNARQPFVVVRTTGWVLSERAIKEIGLANLQVGGSGGRRQAGSRSVIGGMSE